MSLIDMLGVDQNGNASPLDARNTAATDPISAIERVASQKGINPDHLIGLAKLETRLGDATIKGDGQDTYNLFNIKDFSKDGTGIRARDKAEGSNDRYRKYGSYDESVEDLIGLLERRYPVALNASTPEEFASALKAGGYATDPAYVQKLTHTIGSRTNSANPKSTTETSGNVLDQLFSQDEAVSLISGGSDGLVESAYKPIKDRSFGDVLQDTGLATLKIGPTALKSVAEVGDMLTGGKIDLGVAQSMQRGMDAFDELGSDGFKRSKEGFAAVMQDDSKGIGDMFAYALDNPAILVDNVIPTVGSMFLPAGAAKAAAGGARLMGAAQPVVQKAAVATSIGAGAAQNAAQTFAELKDQSLQDRYAGAATSFAVSALMGIATGGGADGTIARRMAGDLQQGKIGLDKVKSFFKSIGKEAPQEAGEESGNILGKYVGSGELPTLQSASKQVAFSGALGGLMGGGVDIATGQSFGGGGLQPNPTPAPNGPLTRALGAGSSAPQPAPTPVTTPTAAPAATAAPTGAAPAAQPTAQSAPTDPQMAAMSDADLNALIEAIDAADDDAVTDEQWAQYAMAISEANRRAAERDTQAAASAVPAAPAVPSGNIPAPMPTYMPGMEITSNRERPKQTKVLQPRQRDSAASVNQMVSNANNLDWLQVSQSPVLGVGAPVVFGDLPQRALVGAEQPVTDMAGNTIATRYAIVDAGDVIASNAIDGSPVREYETGAPGKLRAIAGNGRKTSIDYAYDLGVAQEKYLPNLLQEANKFGIEVQPQALEAMPRPMLVRIMDESDVTDNFGATTNARIGLGHSDVEQAADDARTFDFGQMVFDERGAPTEDSIYRFIQSLPANEAGNLATKDGRITAQAVKRFMAATFKRAYENDALVQEVTMETDPDAKRVLDAAMNASGVMAALKGRGEFDLAPAVADAMQIAINAARKKTKLADEADNQDIDISDEGRMVARFLARPEVNGSSQRMAAALRQWGKTALAQAETQAAEREGGQGNLLGEPTPTMSRKDLFAELKVADGSVDQSVGEVQPGDILNGSNLPFKAPKAAEIKAKNDQFSIQAREALAKREAEKAAAQQQAETVAIEDIPDDLQPEDVVEAPSDFALEAQTQEQLQAQADERAAEEKRQSAEEQAAEAKAQADAEVDSFTLTGSDRPADANPNQGDLLAADQPQQGDVLNNVGQPFTSPKAAEIKAKKDGKGGQVVPVQGGYVVRMPQNMSGKASGTMGTRTDFKAGPGFTAADVVRRDPIVGQKINDEWTAFSPQSGTLGIPRAQMPQVKASDRGAMVNFLKARGIDSSKEQLPPTALKPTQAEFSPAKVQEAADRTDGDRSIIVSADGHVVDGHHQWLAQRQKGEPINVIRLDQPITQVLDALKEMPSAQPEQKPADSKPNQPPAQYQQAQAATESVASDTLELTAPTASDIEAQPAAGAANAEQTQQSQPNGLPQGARLETADRGMVQGMVRYVDGAGLPLSDWAEDEVDALAQAIQRGRGAPAEKLLRDHFVAAARADTAMQGNDAAQMLRVAQERDALVKQLVDAGYTQAEIGANSLGLPLEEFNRLVKEGIYSRERGAPDSLFPKRSTSRKAAAGPGKNSKPKQPPARTAEQRRDDAVQTLQETRNSMDALLAMHGDGLDPADDVIEVIQRAASGFDAPEKKKLNRFIKEFTKPGKNGTYITNERQFFDLLPEQFGYSQWLLSDAINDLANEAQNQPQAQAQKAQAATENVATTAQSEDAPLPPKLSSQLQEAHKAMGRGVTRRQVQSMRDRIASEIETGTTNNGGVVGKLRPAMITQRKAQLARLDKDLALFDSVAPNGGDAAAGQDQKTEGLDRRIAETQARLDALRKSQSESGSNAWAWDKRIADAEKALNAYKEAKRSIEASNQSAAQASQNTAADYAVKDIDRKIAEAEKRLDALRKRPKDEPYWADQIAGAEAQLNELLGAKRAGERLATTTSQLMQAAKDNGKLEVVTVGDKKEAKRKNAEAEPANQSQAEDRAKQDAIKAHNLPQDTVFKPGKGVNGVGKWIAESGGTRGNLSESIDAAAQSLANAIESVKRGAEKSAQYNRLAESVAAKLKAGEQPSDVELRDLFGLEPGQTYVDQSVVGGFLVDYMGVSRNKIRTSLGVAAGDRTSDGGAKYPIAYPRKLHLAFGPDPKPAASDAAKASDYGAKNTLVSQSRAEELRAKLREKAKNNLFGGLDTEMMAWGTELAVFHLEAGIRKFSDLAAAMARDLGTTPIKLKPYLRSWYNGARDMMEDHGLSVDGMDSPDVVRTELAKIDSQNADAAQSGPEPGSDTNKSLTEIFTGLDSSGLPKAQATEAAKAHPQADLIEQVNSQFHDLLLDLMETQGVLEVNGQTTETEDNKSCL